MISSRELLLAAVLGAIMGVLGYYFTRRLYSRR